MFGFEKAAKMRERGTSIWLFDDPLFLEWKARHVSYDKEKCFSSFSEQHFEKFDEQCLWIYGTFPILEFED